MRVKKVYEDIAYRCPVFSVIVRDYEYSDGEKFTRNVVWSGEVVHILPYDSAGYVYLINEFRPGAEDTIYGFPAGRIDPGETPEEAARREVEEEINMRVVKSKYLGDALSTPGICNENSHFFLALVENIEPGDRKYFLDDTERIEPVRVLPEEAEKYLYLRGKPNDVKSRILFLEYKLLKQE